MNPLVCVHCKNKKTINSTTNRLVTESCGHVKCMECLLNEKFGCSACSVKNQEKPDKAVEEADVNKQDVGDSDVMRKKKKLETSHIREEKDGNVTTYVCICNKRFHARSMLAYHSYCNGQRKPYHCQDCDKSFAALSHYKYHMRVHRNERTYNCDICNAGFITQSKLQRHKLKHTKEKKFACTECNKAFNNLTSLRKHRLTHSEERPYVCKACGLKFRDRSNYRKHVVNKHDDSSPACAQCPRAGALPPRPHACPRCVRAFHSRKDMRRHLNTHTDAKPFRCKVCNRCFRRKDNLERHIRNTHPDVSSRSAICDESANEPSTLNLTMPSDNNKQKIELEKLNPLPPLPQEVIQKHMWSSEVNGKTDIDKSSIIQANTTRQSVIFGPLKEPVKIECEYIHKKKAASQISLPPIDGRKILEVKNESNNLDVGRPKNLELLKKILYDKPDKDVINNCDDKIDNASPKRHWKRKIAQSELHND